MDWAFERRKVYLRTTKRWLLARPIHAPGVAKLGLEEGARIDAVSPNLPGNARATLSGAFRKGQSRQASECFAQ